jgi:uncharacterized membrane protein
MGAYLTLLALSIVAIVLGGRNLVGMIFAVSGIGVGVSAFLVYLQVAVIKAMCFWCGLSALTMTSIFAVGLALLHGMRRLNPSEPAAKEG